ncbi:MAG TPA: S1C family serine protease [Patescibacteria group bacterium]|nr:S1C family serine protease [Patescibacteria group bacterium]
MAPSAPAAEYEKEIRALYRERNERTFGQPHKSHGGVGRRLVDFTALLVLIGTVSVAASISVYNWLVPTGLFITAEQRLYPTMAQPELADDFVKQLAGSAATVFAARSVKANASLSEQSYLANEALGQALVLSSDGWLVTTQAVVAEASDDYVVVPADGRVYQVTAVALDPAAPLAYLKIANRNLTAIPFAAVNELTVNAPVVAIVGESQSTARSWYLRYLANMGARTPLVGRAELPVASESLPDRFLLDQALPAGSKGAPIVSLQGKVVGLAADYGGVVRGVVPLANLSPVMETLFAEQAARRPLIGLTYVQSTWLLTPSSPGSAGAVLTSAARRAAVVSNSPAAKAGLKEGDSIVAIDNEPLNYLSLSFMLQRYRPGATVELTVERAGKEQKVKVTLGEVEGESNQIKTE